MAGLATAVSTAVRVVSMAARSKVRCRWPASPASPASLLAMTGDGDESRARDGEQSAAGWRRSGEEPGRLGGEREFISVCGPTCRSLAAISSGTLSRSAVAAAAAVPSCAAAWAWLSTIDSIAIAAAAAAAAAATAVPRSP